jgi:hypothetical protein
LRLDDQRIFGAQGGFKLAVMTSDPGSGLPRASRDCASAWRRRAPHDHEAVAFEARDEAFRDDRRHQLGRLRFRQTAVARQSEGDARAEVLGAGRRQVVLGLRHPPTIAGE